LVQWTALAIANLATELRLSIELGQANCCEVLVQVKASWCCGGVFVAGNVCCL
jgi:hypothetical protein